MYEWIFLISLHPFKFRFLFIYLVMQLKVWKKHLECNTFCSTQVYFTKWAIVNKHKPNWFKNPTLTYDEDNMGMFNIFL